MTLDHLPPRRRRLLLATGSILIAALPAAASAQAVEGGTAQVYGLTPEQKLQVIDARDRAGGDAALADALSGGVDRSVHGEFGAMIGTGGARGVFGTAAIPIGDNAGAVVSFESTRFGDRRYR